MKVNCPSFVFPNTCNDVVVDGSIPLRLAQTTAAAAVRVAQAAYNAFKQDLEKLQRDQVSLGTRAVQITSQWALLQADPLVMAAEVWYNCGGYNIPTIQAGTEKWLDLMDVDRYNVLKTSAFRD